MKCPIFCSLGFSVGNVIFNEKVSLTNSMGDSNSRELASPTELVSSSHSRVDELPLRLLSVSQKAGCVDIYLINMSSQLAL